MDRGKGHGWLQREEIEDRICKPGKGELKQSAEILLGNWSVVKSTRKVKKQHQQDYFECFLRHSVVSKIDHHIYTRKFLQ